MDQTLKNENEIVDPGTIYFHCKANFISSFKNAVLNSSAKIGENNKDIATRNLRSSFWRDGGNI